MAAWSIWGQDMFPRESDPSGGKFACRLRSSCSWVLIRPRNLDKGRVAKMVGSCKYFGCIFAVPIRINYLLQRNLHPNANDTKSQLLERVKANLRTPRNWSYITRIKVVLILWWNLSTQRMSRPQQRDNSKSGMRREHHPIPCMEGYVIRSIVKTPGWQRH